MALHFHEIVDCRMLQLELRAYHLSLSEVKKIAEYCYHKTLELLDNVFFSYWCWDCKFISHDKIYDKIRQTDTYNMWGFDADIISESIYNNKTFRQYAKELAFDTSTTLKNHGISIDYIDRFDKYFTDVNDSQSIKSAVLKIFNEDGRKKMAFWRSHDFSGIFSTFEYDQFSNLYRVNFSLQIALQCLGSHTCDYAKKMTELLIELSEITPNIGGHVNISPIHWPARSTGHLQYFGGNIGDNASKFQHRKEGYLDVEWYPYYYIGGAEWFNVISPLQMQHLQCIDKNQEISSGIICKKLSSGGMAVFLNKNITDTDVSDLKNIKQLLYNALYPGHGKILLCQLFNRDELTHFCKPRPQWELVPMFDDEVEVTQDRIIFKHKNCCVI